MSQQIAEAVRDWRRWIPALSGITFLTALDQQGVDVFPRSVLFVTAQPTRSLANVPFEVIEKVTTQVKTYGGTGDVIGVMNTLFDAHGTHRNNYGVPNARARIHWFEFVSASDAIDRGGLYDVTLVWRGRASR